MVDHEQDDPERGNGDEPAAQPGALAEADPAEEQDGEDDEQHDAGHVTAGDLPEQDLAARVGQEQPGEHVGDETEAASDGQDDDQCADEEGVDPDPTSDPGADPAEPTG